jgi:hypothetical protein
MQKGAAKRKNTATGSLLEIGTPKEAVVTVVVAGLSSANQPAAKGAGLVATVSPPRKRE